MPCAPLEELTPLRRLPVGTSRWSRNCFHQSLSERSSKRYITSFMLSFLPTVGAQQLGVEPQKRQARECPVGELAHLGRHAFAVGAEVAVNRSGVGARDA